MKRLQRVLSESVDREVLRAARAYSVLREWDSIVGESLAKRCRPDGYERGTVWIAVQGSAWAQELRMLEPKILAKLAEASGDATLFQSLRFGVRPVPPARIQEAKLRHVEQPELESMSIREIAERRLRRLKDAEGD